MTWSVSALINLPQKWAEQWRHFLGCRKSLFKICICLTELDLKLYFLTKAILQILWHRWWTKSSSMSIPPEDHHRSIGKGLQKWSILACSRQNVPGRSINFSYSFSLIRSFVFCTGCNWFWSSQLWIKFLNLSWKVKIYLLTWRRKLRYRDPPPPLKNLKKKLLTFALLEKTKKEKKNICLGISLIS